MTQSTNIELTPEEQAELSEKLPMLLDGLKEGKPAAIAWFASWRSKRSLGECTVICVNRFFYRIQIFSFSSQYTESCAMIWGQSLVRIVHRFSASCTARYTALNNAVSVGNTFFPRTVFRTRLFRLSMGLVVYIRRRISSGYLKNVDSSGQLRRPAKPLPLWER